MYTAIETALQYQSVLNFVFGSNLSVLESRLAVGVEMSPRAVQLILDLRTTKWVQGSGSGVQLQGRSEDVWGHLGGFTLEGSGVSGLIFDLGVRFQDFRSWRRGNVFCFDLQGLGFGVWGLWCMSSLIC